jgi:hypothetical protein
VGEEERAREVLGRCGVGRRDLKERRVTLFYRCVSRKGL